jgi:hypothetical protein
MQNLPLGNTWDEAIPSRAVANAIRSASLILAIEQFRKSGLYAGIVLAFTLSLFCMLIHHLRNGLTQSDMKEAK